MSEKETICAGGIEVLLKGNDCIIAPKVKLKNPQMAKIIDANTYQYFLSLIEITFEIQEKNET